MASGNTSQVTLVVLLDTYYNLSHLTTESNNKILSFEGFYYCFTFTLLVTMLTGTFIKMDEHFSYQFPISRLFCSVPVFDFRCSEGDNKLGFHVREVFDCRVSTEK